MPITKFCEIILPDLDEVKTLLQLSKEEKISNFGPLYFQLKTELEQYLQLDSDHTVVIVSSGHVALMASLSVLRSKRVVVPSYTFASTAQASRLQKIKTTIIDVEHDTSLPSWSTLEKEKDNFDTLLMVCPLSRVPKELEDYGAWCDLNKKFLIIDGAATFGTIGSHLTLGDFYCMSFHATKNLPIGEAGCVICPKDKEQDVIRYINFGAGPDKRIVSPGLNGKVSEYTCAIGLSLLHKIAPYLEQRKKTCDFYCEHLVAKHFGSRENTVYASFPIYVSGINRAKSKREQLKREGIECLQYYIPLDYSPVANSLFDSNICLPCHSGVSLEAVNTIVDIVNE
jgi:dTDP-4-amino-4,6-dideoxygalactose transaminase